MARTTHAEDAVQQLASTKEAFSAEGWETVAVPPLGDESTGLTQTTEGEGGATASYSYLFRKGRWISMIGLRRRTDVTKMEDAIALAIVVSQRVDRALASVQPDGGSGAPSATRTRAPLTERVRVVSPGGANVWAEPSTSATVIVEAPDGLIFEVAGPNRDAKGRTWRNVRLSDGQTGWIASTLVEPIVPPPATSPAPRVESSPSPSGPASATPVTPESGAAGSAPESADVTEATGQTSAPDEGAAPITADSEVASAPTAAATTPASELASIVTSASSSNTVHAAGPDGLAVLVVVRELKLASGDQQVRVLVTRYGQPVSEARVDVTTRLAATDYRVVYASRTDADGRGEVAWPMEGPPGDYELIVEVRPNDTEPPATATTKFRWQ